MGYPLLGEAWAKLYGGLQGNGKSYSAVLQMALIASAGGHISTNVVLKKEGFETLCLRRHGKRIKFDEQVTFLTDDQIPLFHLHSPQGTDESPNLVVIDECDLFWFKSDSAATRTRCRDTISFLKLCRQENTLVIFMTQKEDLLDKSLRDLTEKWDFRDMAKFRLLGWKPLGNWLVSIQRAAKGSLVIDRKWNRKDLSVFDAYESKQFKGRLKRSGIKGKVELESVNNGSAFRAFLKRFWLPILFIIGAWWFWGVDHKAKSVGEHYPEPHKSKPTVHVPDYTPGAPRPARASAAAPDKPAIFTGPDGFEYVIPPISVLVCRAVHYGREPMFFLAAPPYPRPETLRIGDYSATLGRIITGMGNDKGRRFVTYDNGTIAFIVNGRSHFYPRDGAGSGNSGGNDGPAGTPDVPRNN